MTDMAPVGDRVAWIQEWAHSARTQRAGHLEAAERLTGDLTATAALLREVANILDPPPVPEDVAVAWDGFATEPRTEPVLTQAEYDTALKDGRLTLRPRVWPAACEQCGASTGQPCQAVTE